MLSTKYHRGSTALTSCFKKLENGGANLTLPHYILGFSGSPDSSGDSEFNRSDILLPRRGADAVGFDGPGIPLGG